MTALKHLRKDKTLSQIIPKIVDYHFVKTKHIHLSLCSSIISQQISTKAAESIRARFHALFATSHPSPQEILQIPVETLRTVGLSTSKSNYIRNVCTHFIEYGLTDKKLYSMSSEELHSSLIQIKGVGDWSIEMLQIFAFGEEDIFSVKDMGIQQAMISLYDLKSLSPKEIKQEMLQISEYWKPFRSYACRILWAWKDTKKNIK